MTRTISFINFKGGVGKTTLTCELAARLAFAHNKRVLLVDMDPQTNASFYFMDFKTWEQQVNNQGSLKDLYEAYLKSGLSASVFDINQVTMRDFYVNPDTQGHSLQKLSLIPAHLEMMGVEADLAFEIGRSAGSPGHLEKVEGLKRYYEILNALRTVLSPVKELYDFVFFDCPPSVGLLTQSALAASDAYVVPVIPDYLSTVGVAFLHRRVLDLVTRVNAAQRAMDIEGEFHGPQRKGIVLCRVRVYRWGPPLDLVSPQDIVYNRLLRDKTLSGVLFKSFMSETARVQESAEEKIPVAIRSGNKYAQPRAQVEELAKEFLARV